MNVVKSGHIANVQDEIGNIRTYYVNDTLPECYNVPEDYYTNGIVEKKENYTIKKVKKNEVTQEELNGLK
ncbi:MAG TPA: hypothetical protein DGG95_13605 [Cytophagales bacterium]|jgi:hypothetical protein|nr:hypothetical protein [Cytophagales bacterium]